MDVLGWMQSPVSVSCRSMASCQALTGPSDRKQLLPKRLKANVLRSRLFTSTKMQFWHFASWMFSWIKSSRFTRKVCSPRGIVYFQHIPKHDGRVLFSKNATLEQLHALTLQCGSTMLELFFVTCSAAQSCLSSVLVYLPDPVIFVICPWANVNRCVTRGNGFPPDQTLIRVRYPLAAAQ